MCRYKVKMTSTQLYLGDWPGGPVIPIVHNSNQLMVTQNINNLSTEHNLDISLSASK